MGKLYTTETMHPLARLLDVVFPPRADELVLRDTASLIPLLEPRLIAGTRPKTTALFSFRDDSVRAAIHELKYHGSRKGRTLLADALAEYLVEFSADAYGALALVPVPLSPARLKARGFNQCEVVARDAIRISAAPIRIALELLTRTKDTEHQTRLSRLDRLANMSGAFATPRACDPEIAYVLFDDVVTTGATLQAGIDALKSAGARRILPLALAG